MISLNDKVMFKKGIESELYPTRIWKCDCDEFTSYASQKQVVFLKGFKGLVEVSKLKTI